MKSPEQELFDRLQGAANVKPSASTEGSPVEAEMLRAEPEMGTTITLRNLFTHQEAHPVVLDFALLKAFQLEWLTWEPETIWAEIKRTFQSEISEINRAKINIIKTLHVSSSPWAYWQVFEKVVQGLNNIVPRWAHMQVPSLEQLYAAIDMMNGIREMEFSDEVKLYMASAVIHEGVCYVPAPLDFIQVEVSKPYFHCFECGSEDEALFHDGICDTCSGKFDPEQGLSMRPKDSLVNAGHGKNVELRVKYDPEPIRTRYDQVKDVPLKKVDLSEVDVDIQVARLLVARDYMNIRRKQLVEQITNLKAWLGTA